ncbi:MAG: hypothetical protein ABRQ39_32470 [Candidatus Eremiobacterota bacterium]
MPIIEERVDRLEFLVAQTQLMIQGLTVELRREMKDFKEELKRDTKEMKKEINNQWEKMVKKQGTLVEDMVSPNIKFIGEKYFNCKEADCESFAIRFEKQYPKIKGTVREFDVIAVYPDKVIVNETKSNPKPELAVEFIDFIKSGEFFVYFPEYKGKELIPIFASFYIPDNVLKKLTKNKIYAMGIKEDTMDILNPKF